MNIENRQRTDKELGLRHLPMLMDNRADEISPEFEKGKATWYSARLAGRLHDHLCAIEESAVEIRAIADEMLGVIDPESTAIENRQRVGKVFRVRRLARLLHNRADEVLRIIFEETT